MPNRLFLAPLIRTLLNAGVPRASLTVLVATGLHRPNEGQELAQLAGGSVSISARISAPFRSRV